MLSEMRDQNVKKFLQYILKELDLKDTKLCLDANLSRIGARTSGYYSSFDQEIRCFIDISTNDYLGTICHEYSHFKQRHTGKLGTKEWQRFESLDITMEDIQIKRISKEKLKEFGSAIIALEWDAEKRAIQLIKKFKLPILLNEYVQEANVTLWRYVFLYNRQIWVHLKNKDYDQVLMSMPVKLINKNNLILDKIPPLLMSQFEELRIK